MIECRIQLLSGAMRVGFNLDAHGKGYFLSVPFTFDGRWASVQGLTTPEGLGVSMAQVGLAIRRALRREGYQRIRWDRYRKGGEFWKTVEFDFTRATPEVTPAGVCVQNLCRPSAPRS